MKTLKYFISIIIIFFVVISSTQAQDKYAVLICGDGPGGGTGLCYNSSDANEPEFWHDTYLMWEMLIEQGYDNDNIFVLYNGGLDYHPLDGIAQRYNPREEHWDIIDPDGHITDYYCNKANVEMVFNGFVDGFNNIPIIDNNDFLFVWTFGHASYFGPNFSKLKLKSGLISDYDFAALVNQVSCDKKVILMHQCFAGSFAQYFENKENTIFFSAANDMMEASSTDNKYYDDIDFPGDEDYGETWNAYEDDKAYYFSPPDPPEEQFFIHGEFNLHIMNSLRGITPAKKNYYTFYDLEDTYYIYLSEADVDEDNITSLYEASLWEYQYDSKQAKIAPTADYHDPQWRDFDNIGSTTSLKYPTIIHSNVGVSETINGIIRYSGGCSHTRRYYLNICRSGCIS